MRFRSNLYVIFLGKLNWIVEVSNLISATTATTTTYTTKSHKVGFGKVECMYTELILTLEAERLDYFPIGKNLGGRVLLMRVGSNRHNVPYPM